MTSDLTLNATCVLGPVAVLTFSGGGDQIVEKWQGNLYHIFRYKIEREC